MTYTQMEFDFSKKMRKTDVSNIQSKKIFL